jgi:RNA polymerase sigma factor (TIGR02999 family)
MRRPRGCMLVAAMDTPPGITELLHGVRRGEADAMERLLPLVYDALHRIAHRQLGHERAGHTLGTTAVVHEAYLRLVDQGRTEWHDRAHFYGVASLAMRRVLLDYARRHRAEKRGGARGPITLDDALVAAEARADALVALDEALDRLAAVAPRLARVVELRFFGGLTEADAGTVLGVDARTVRRDWTKAKAWLHEELSDGA